MGEHEAGDGERGEDEDECGFSEGVGVHFLFQLVCVYEGWCNLKLCESCVVLSVGVFCVCLGGGYVGGPLCMYMGPAPNWAALERASSHPTPEPPLLQTPIIDHDLSFVSPPEAKGLSGRSKASFRRRRHANNNANAFDSIDL
jgi:hypothetical protein